MTEQEKQQLSRDVAEKYGIDELRHGGYDHFGDELDAIWLHEDSGRCLDLMTGNLNIETIGLTIIVKFRTRHGFGYVERTKSDFNDDAECLRITILEAMLAKG